ncbi:MAG: response regulator, partial [Gammaproteobacteria bacterium]
MAKSADESRSVVAKARGISFRQQLVLVFTIGIACLALASSLATSTLSNRLLRGQIMEQGQQATQTLAAQSTLALLYQSPENAEEATEAILAFPGVRGVSVFDLAHNALLAKGVASLPSEGPAQWPERLQMDQETKDHWYFVAPVHARGGSKEDQHSPFAGTPHAAELLGYVRVVMGKEDIRALAGEILGTNLGVSIALAALLLFILLATTARLTTPLGDLAVIMKRAQAGEIQVRAKLQGTRDIVEMENAFNTMMAVLEAREGELEKARDAALELARIKSEFAANVSHELRTPLSGVLSILDLLHDMGLTPKQREYVLLATNAGESLLHLIGNILDFSRIEAGKMALLTVDFSLRGLLDEVLALTSGQAERKELDLGYVLADGVPAMARGEAARIRQILINLVGNAIKFTERGEVAIEVKVEAIIKDQLLLRFEIRDSGIGIAPDAQVHIFEAFTQADGSTTRKYGGTGLGLAISRKLAHLMGGDIGVESEPGKGSLFWFTVPLDQATSEEAPQTHMDSSITALRMLIVDDSEVNRRYLRQTLSRWGIRSDAAPSGALALQRLSDKQGPRYDILVVDEEMPFMGGRELARELGSDAKYAGTKIIMMTTHSLSVQERELPPNIIGQLAKPVRDSALYDCMVSVVANRKDTTCTASVYPDPTRSCPSHVGIRVLVVEDNRVNQKIAFGMLNRLGCRVEVAANGNLALERLGRQSFDLVFMDCHMPEMDGYEATKRIRSLEDGRARVPIIAMTADVHEGVVDNCLAAGMDDYLPKPLKLATLREKLTRWRRPRASEDVSGESEPTTDNAGSDEAVQPLDGIHLGELRASIGAAFQGMVEAFLEDAPMHFESIKKAIAERDANSLRELAHSVKGSAKNLGANQLSRTAKKLEDLGHEGATEAAAQLVAILVSEFEAVKAALRHEVEPGMRETPESTIAQETPRVLVVDDDRGLRQTLCHVLRENGYRVEEAENGAKALAFCKRQLPDLILMDAVMPVMDGFTACGSIRALPGGSDIPVLIITGLDDEHAIEKAFSCGASDYIGKPVHFFVLRQRVTRLLDACYAEKRVRQLAYRDGLTLLPNRNMFHERLETAINAPREDQHVHALLFLDLDRFKLVNDVLGHEIGDLLLKAVGERIQGCVRAGDSVARIGEDEFSVILENIGSAEIAAQVAEKIRKAIATPFSFLGQQVYVGSSLGIAIFPNDTEDDRTLIKQADMALSRAKALGRDRHCFYETGIGASVSSRLELESELRRALERDELTLFYQPKVDLKSGRITGMEALMRWQHPERGVISPVQFIPLAEESGLIVPMGEWAMRSACKQAKAWIDSGTSQPITVAVNVSARQFDQLEDTVARVLDETGLDPRFLELELTESAIMQDPKEMVTKLRCLKEIGVQISIDDFGTGYSSLSYLKHFPFDNLKIDRSFINNVTV